MLGIAQAIGSSKESLYSWFGNKEGLVAELIREQAQATNQAVAQALSQDGQDPRDALMQIGYGLLTLLTGPTSVSLNRAAATSPELAAELLKHGRHTTGALVAEYLHDLALAGRLSFDERTDPFEVFFGLVIRDKQIRTILGEPAPHADEIREQVSAAVDQFLQLYSTTSSTATATK